MPLFIRSLNLRPYTGLDDAMAWRTITCFLPLALATPPRIGGLSFYAPRAGLRAEVKGVGVRNNENAASLAVDNTIDHCFELFVSRVSGT